MWNAAASMAGASPYDPDAQVYFARTSGMTTTAKDEINTLVENLKTNGYWNQLDCLHVAATANSTSVAFDNMLQNIRQNAFNATKRGTPSFTYDTGVTISGASQIIDSGFANTATTNFQRYDHMFGVYAMTAATTGRWMGVRDTEYTPSYVEYAEHGIEYQSSTKFIAHSNNQNYSHSTSGNTGVLVVQRTSSSNMDSLRLNAAGTNTDYANSVTGGSSYRDDGDTWGVGGEWDRSVFGAPTDAVIGAWFIGASLSTAGMEALEQEIHDYFDRLGTAV